MKIYMRNPIKKDTSESVLFRKGGNSLEQNSFGNPGDRFFTKWNFLLLVSGLAINVVMLKIVVIFHLPLHLDTLGTILAGALGGVVPGMTVGFLSNAFNSVTAPVMLYYGILSVAIGALSGVLSEKGYLKSVRGWLFTSIAFVLLTATVGGVITWLLNDSSIGGTSAPIGLAFVSRGVAPYFAQLLGDLTVELPDKLLMVGVVCLILTYSPPHIIRNFPLGSFYQETEVRNGDGGRLKGSISKRITYIVIASVLFTCIFTIAVCLVYYMQQIRRSSENFAYVVSQQAAGYVDGDLVPAFLAQGEAQPEYKKTEEELGILLENARPVKYLFVYAVHEDGVHVVFDIDTPGLKGEEPGTILTPEQGVSSDYQNYIHGEEIPMAYSNGEFGNILTVYTRIFDSAGRVAAYAGADIDMAVYYQDFIIFTIQVVSITFAIALLLFTFILWYVHKHISGPIQLMVRQTERLKDISPEHWVDSEEWKSQISLNTQDELQQLDETVSEIEKTASLSMKRLLETEQELLQTKELEKVNRKLEAAVQKAEAATKSKTMFLSNMSHDMRTPMNAIIGLSNLAMDLQTVEELKDYMNQINLSGRQLLALINDTLDVSRIENGKLTMNREYIMSSQMLQEGVVSTKVVAEQKGVHFRLEQEDFRDALLYVDAVKITKLFTNLLSNAVKFTPPGGEVVFFIRRLGEKDHCASYCMGVRDTGIGMSREFQEHIFEPFSQERTDRATNATGTGLGMTIVKEFADFLGAKLEIQSELGKGTKITVWMSFQLADKLPEELQEQTQAAMGTGNRILVAEDHPLNAKIMRKLLEKKGYCMDHAHDGKECVSMFLESKPGHYGLILMDIRMPEMDGLEAARAIRSGERADAKTIPIIAMTANAFEQDVEASMRAGMNEHLSKPVEPEKLYAVLQRFLSEAESRS